MPLPLAIKYLRARASFYSSIRFICKKLNRSAYVMMCKHADKAFLILEQCETENDCSKCPYERECNKRYDNIIDIG